MRKLVFSIIFLCNFVVAQTFSLKYRSNYLIPATIIFDIDEKHYQINARMSLPFYKISFVAFGDVKNKQMQLHYYQELRNSKPYALAKIENNQILYGKAGEKKSQVLQKEVFDIFSTIFQLAYFGTLPNDFYITTGKNIHPFNPKNIDKTQNSKELVKICRQNVTYSVVDNDKLMSVTKCLNEPFPRIIKYSKDGRNFKLTLIKQN